MQALKRGFSAAFGVDTRSLSLYRVCLACVVVLDLLDRLRDLRAHYSDEGYWPRRVAIQYAGEDSHLCVHMLNGSVGFAAILFAIHFMFAVAMFVGYRTRLATFLVWFMTTSLQSRNYFVGHSGDTYLRMMLFWSIFMPLGEHFSLDRLRNNTSAKDKAAYIYVGVGSVGALFQLMYVYTGSALEKRTRAWDAWYREGEATYWALHSIPYFLTSFGVLMAGLDKSILRLMTWSVLAWEAVGPFTMMSPWKTEKLRMVGVIGTFMLHFGFALCMKLEEFVWLGCTAAFFALPPLFWDSIVPRMIPKSRAKTDVTLQHSASFLSLARTLETFLLIPNLRLTRTLDEEEGGHSSVEGHGHALTLYAPDGRTLHDADALIGALALSPVAWPLSKVKQPWHMLFMCYRVLLLLEVAEALYPEDAPRSPRTKRRPANATTLHMFLQIYFSGTLWLNVIGACCVLWVLLWNLGNVGLGSMPGFFYAFGQPMMLDQTWNMFAPPPKHVTWHLIELRLKSGPPQELIKAGGLWHWRGVPLHNTPPEPLYYNYGNHRNFKYWENYSFSSQNIDSRLEFGRWICREWNARHTGDAVLQSHKTHYYYTPADLPANEQLQKAQTEVMWDHSCF